jgi:hypothetical protein
LALVLILPLAYGAVLLGTEQEIIKYGQEFSALQFLLSPDRQSYVSGGSLVFRYVIAHFSIQALLVVTQIPVWLWLAQGRRSVPAEEEREVKILRPWRSGTSG